VSPILPGGLRADEIRILQEFRVQKTRELGREQIEAIRYPGGMSPEALDRLVERGYLEKSERDTFVLAAKGDEVLSIDHQPLYERG
jgi:DNA-binding MarR family transcriptional regulator